MIKTSLRKSKLQEKTLIIYTRVSDPNSKKETSHEVQESECRRQGKELGYTKFIVLSEKQSGFDFWDRPILQDALRMVTAKEADGLMTHVVDRLSREPMHLGELLHIFDRAQGALHFANDDIKQALGTIEGEMVFWIKAICAKYEAKQIARRTIDGKRKRLTKGNLHGWGHEKYGFRRVVRLDDGRSFGIFQPEARQLRSDDNGGFKLVREIYEPEAAVVRLVFELRAHKRWSARKITNHLIAIGAPAPTSNTRERLESWSPSTVDKMIKSRDYIGETILWRRKNVKLGDGRKVIAHDEAQQVKMPDYSTPAIIDARTFELANKKLKQTIKTISRNEKTPVLMRGRVRCAVCGDPMYFFTQHKYMARARVHHTYEYYRCRSRELAYTYNSMKKCAGSPVRADGDTGLHADVLRRVREILTDREWLKAQMAKLEAKAVDPMMYGLRTDCQNEITKIERRLGNLATAVENAEDDDDVRQIMLRRGAVKEQLNLARERLSDVERQISRREQSAINLSSILANLDAIRDRLSQGSFDDQRFAVEALGIEAVVSGNGGKISAKVVDQLVVDSVLSRLDTMNYILVNFEFRGFEKAVAHA